MCNDEKYAKNIQDQSESARKLFIQRHYLAWIFYFMTNCLYN